ncbi:hypothetical protein DM02DRAFT_600670 [Periconia macrospinosa]|uniref:Zn(2)-C6 fungal-type domain-containing protein n=1 Tax=Periconia macrospinosa TaxID=97972 RepID=A0A2V1DC10_9PLEO|nr:hypothetical protein DM02DRAFT_600670 [Periconia macrospinosa]
MNGLSDENRAKRRKLRKGTHSCWECRRRKVKCTFASAEDAVCITCRRRGAQCASQTTAFDERLVSSLVTHVSIPTPVSAVDSVAVPTAHVNVTLNLLRAFPSQDDIEILLEHVNKLSLLCYQSNYKSKDEKTYETLKESMSMTNLLSPEVHPVLIARQMLLFAIALQYLSPDDVFPGLTKHHHAIMEDLAESAIKMVNMDDVLLGTLEGIENFILEGLYHIDGGNIRRAWITMRRAVMAAQLLGLHKPGHYCFKVISNHSKLDPEVMWPCIVSMERALSLLLGLPSNTLALSSMVQNATSSSIEGSGLVQVMTYLTAKVLERNQIQGSPQALDLTREVDHQFLKMTGNLPSTFWRPPSFAGLEVDSVEAFFEIRRTLDYMCYYSVVNQLHLPYILCPNHSSQSIYSRNACVNASREILTREIAIRTFNPVATCSRMGEFMALIAGMTLILVHLVSDCQESTSNVLAHQRSSDRATVERALECMASMSELRDDALSAKCVVLLRDLLAVEQDAAQDHTYRAHALERINDDEKDNPNTLIINVPYLGIVRIARDGMVSMTPFKKTQDREVVEDVTIGGIGSLRVNSPRMPDSNNTDSTSDVAAVPQEAISEAINAPSTVKHSGHIPQSISEDIFAQQDQFFPNASASIDDWVLQGFDNAFFDVLMHGAGDQQLNSASDEDWTY